MNILILLLFGLCACLQFMYWAIMFSRFAFYKEKANTLSCEYPVSVVICAYNEEENIKQHLPKILSQSYSDFEVLVVNDASTDRTASILSQLKKKHGQLNILNLNYPNGKKNIGKKHALSEGIKNAKHDTILVTDADCHPTSNQWIDIMVNALKGRNSIGLGYGPYEKSHGFLNVFIRFETVYTAIQYMSLSLWGLPYMGVGRNMVYDRSLFVKAGGFDRHAHIASGDDDLFVNEIANQKNTSIVINRESHMYSPPEKSWKGYFRQKSRHMTTGRHYKLIHQILLGLLSLSHFGLYLFAFLSIIYGISTIFVLILFFIVVLTKLIIFSRIASKLNERSLIPFFLFLDIIYILYYVLLAPALFWGKTSKWK